MFPYLFNLTRNRALNYLEHKKIQKNNHVRQHLADDPTYTLSDDSAREELLERILARIELLPERCSQVMKLSFIECKKYKEIAEELNIFGEYSENSHHDRPKNLTGRISRFSPVAPVHIRIDISTDPASVIPPATKHSKPFFCLIQLSLIHLDARYKE